MSVRVGETTRETLRELAEEYGEKNSVLLEEAVEDLRRKKFLEGANAEYLALRSDPKAAADTDREHGMWDALAADGLTRKP